MAAQGAALLAALRADRVLLLRVRPPDRYWLPLWAGRPDESARLRVEA